MLLMNAEIKNPINNQTQTGIPSLIKSSKFKFSKPDISSTVYNIVHSKKTIETGFKTKDLAITRANELLTK